LLLLLLLLLRLLFASTGANSTEHKVAMPVAGAGSLMGEKSERPFSSFLWLALNTVDKKDVTRHSFSQ